MEGKTQLNWWLVISVILFIFIIWAASPFVFEKLLVGLEQRSQFGDSYGVVNALFSGLAFGGVIIAILLQRIELKLQREELSLTRNELAKSAIAQEASGNYLGEQAEVMKVTAHLNGLAAVIQARTSEIEYQRRINELGEKIDMKEIKALAEERMKNIEELESLMHGVLCAADYGR